MRAPHRFLSCLLLSVTLLFALGPSSTASAALELEPVISGLESPVRLVSPPADVRLFVVERIGRIRVFDKQGVELGTFLDVQNKTSTLSERGLLGLAFPPDYDTSGRFYVSYTASSDGRSVLSRYQVDDQDENSAVAASEEILLEVAQPQANHNGGHIEFGPDGMLYFGLGDGGGAGDTANNAQNDQTLLGKMLRLDVSGASGYSVPADNPFVGDDPLDEIWALGLRNPWCFSFDPEGGDLYIADVGQNLIEEVDVQPVTSAGGENYGWRLMEGSDCFNPSTNCNDGSLVLPVHEYLHESGRCSITGGYVYRGDSAPEVEGRYLFSDYCTSEIWSLRWTQAEGLIDVINHTSELDPDRQLGRVAGFGQDSFGAVYILDFSRGEALRIVDPDATGIGGESSSVGELKARWREESGGGEDR